MTTLIPKYDLKNGGSTPTGAINRPINEKLAEVVSVLDFGADATGTTDSATAIQAAINTGNTIFFPKGLYLVSTPLLPLTNQVLYGAGKKASIVRATTNNQAAVISYPSGTYSNVSISNLGVDGNDLALIGLNLVGSSQGAISSCAFSQIESGNCKTYNFYFRNTTSCSMYDLDAGGNSQYSAFFQNCFVTNVYNCLFYSGTGAISTMAVSGGSGCVFQSIYLYNNGNNASSVLLVDGGINNNFVECTFEPQNASGTTVAVVELKQTTSSDDGLSDGNSFVRCNWVGIAGTAPYNVKLGTFNACYKTKFNECVFVKQGTSIPSIYLQNQAYTCITNCVDQTGYYDQTYAAVSVTNASGNIYYQEDLAGRFATSIVTASSITGTSLAIAGNISWTSGNGSPNGALVANVGSLYSRLDGGANTTLYVKESGTSSTGWVAK